MFAQRTSWRSASAVLAAAALLAVGVDTVSYSATGDSVLFGRKATTTTTIRNTGAGPALSLVSRAQYPPLKVSNSRLVKKLNADRLDGLGAEQLSPVTTVLTTGVPRVAMPENNLFERTFPAGDYEVWMNGIFIHDGPDTSYNITCLLADERLWDTPMDPDYTRLFLLDSMNYTSGGTDNNYDGVIDQSGVIHLSAPRSLVYGCAASADTIQESPLTVHLRPLNGVQSRTGTPWSVPGPRLERLVQGLAR